jgi:subtilisin family serine protease
VTPSQMRPRSLLPLLLALVACSGGGGGSTVESSPDQRRNVLVVDDGFDPTMVEFAGRVAAYYSIQCAHRALQLPDDDGSVPMPIPLDAAGFDGGASDGGSGLEQRRADLLVALQVKDTTCHLIPGVDPKPDPLAPVARYRDRWNRAIKANQFASRAFTASEYNELTAAQKALEKARFHGTATAGLIAHANPEVRLVLVEELLGSSEEISNDFTCFRQQDLDENVTLFSDPQVRQAYVDQPFSSLDDEFRALGERHHIGVSNESFGVLSRQRLDELQAAKGCIPVDMRPYFAVIGALDSARSLAHPDHDALLVKSAGNDHSMIDGPEDHRMCTASGTPRLIVGAYDDRGSLTEFTNFGNCVDLYAPGLHIITPIPGGWYLPLSGTSFSAPLTARLASLNPMPTPFTTAGARDVLLAMRDNRGRLPLHRFPREVLYDPENALSQFALRVPGDELPAEPALINLRKLREFQRLLRPRAR